MTLEARRGSVEHVDIAEPRVRKKKPSAAKRTGGKGKGLPPLRTIDLFCGAGGITEGFRQAGYVSLYGNDVMPEAIETFKLNHPEAIADCRPIESVEPSEIRKRLGLQPGELDVLVGGPPCQGFSINAPERFLKDPRNKLFEHYERFLEEFQPKAFVFENVPGLLSLGDGKVFRQIVKIFTGLGYSVTAKILFAGHYGVPQERWRLILLGSKSGEVAHPEPT
ncbi:DNA cytosine methyltransferase, partial [Burkholderia gladioli]